MSFPVWMPVAAVGGALLLHIVVAVLLIRCCPPLPWTHRERHHGHGRALAAVGATPTIAHRGGSLGAPENTLAAFAAAVAAGTDMLELDVCESADGVVVVSHDAELGRVAGRPGVHVADLPFAELPPLAPRIPLHFPVPPQGNSPPVEAYGEKWLLDSASHLNDAIIDGAVTGPGTGKTEASCPTDAPGRFCRLEDVFTAHPGAWIHVDCKATSPTLVRRVLALIDAFGRRGRTIVGAAAGPNVGDLRRLVVAHRIAHVKPVSSSPLGPKSATGQASPAAAGGPAGPFFTFASAGQVVLAYMLYYTGLLPWVPLDFDAFDIPFPSAEMRWMLGRFLGHRHCLRAVLPRLVAGFLATPGLWGHLRRRGVQVNVFVLNADASAAEVWRRRLPVDGVMSDDCALLARHRDALATNAAATRT